MNNKSNKNRLLRDRMAIFLVAICCFIVSNSQYLLTDHQESERVLVTASSEGADSESNEDHQSFMDVATEAVVVPFANLVASTTLQLIYEIVGFEDRAVQPRSLVVGYSSYFLEVLLEQIAAPNAP
ncbi:hypothetical protein [Echinicola pacifica]|nr:hypothetical protein [Echinicola pacifica]